MEIKSKGKDSENWTNLEKTKMHKYRDQNPAFYSSAENSFFKLKVSNLLQRSCTDHQLNFNGQSLSFEQISVHGSRP